MVAEDTQTKQGKWPSPFAYYRKLRPQYFSDTVVRYEVPLTQELFDLQLALLSTKKMQSVFENFIVAIAKRNITPNIKPQTGPDGGGVMEKSMLKLMRYQMIFQTNGILLKTPQMERSIGPSP